MMTAMKSTANGWVANTRKMAVITAYDAPTRTMAKVRMRPPCGSARAGHRARLARLATTRYIGCITKSID